MVLFALVGDDGEATREAARRHLSRRYGMEFEPYQIEKLCIAGTPAECVDRIGEYVRAGVRHFSLNPCAAGDDFLDQSRRLHDDVVAHVRNAAATMA